MEPAFAASTGETVTAELRDQLNAAIANTPQAHRLHPSRDEVFESKEAAFICRIMTLQAVEQNNDI
jgi:hypothetical protein